MGLSVGAMHFSGTFEDFADSGVFVTKSVDDVLEKKFDCLE